MNYKTYEVREFKNGDKVWWQNDKQHRLDGPAVECSNGFKAWYIEGNHYTEKGFNEKISSMKNEVTIKGKIYSEDTISLALKEYTKHLQR